MFVNSENREALAAIFAQNKKALRGLHVIAGYDFEKPFSVFKFSCPVTVARVLKETGAAGSMADLCVCLLIHEPGSEWGTHRDFHCVAVDKFGKINISINRAAWIESEINYCCNKSHFEDKRKCPDSVLYAIIQKKEFLRPCTPKGIDLFDRFRLVPGKETRWTDGKGFRGVSDITVKRLDASGESVEIKRQKLYSGGFASNENNPRTVSDFIDKSGYLLPWRRDEMKRRALALRKEKERAAFLQTENGEKVRELAARIETAKIIISKKILAASDYDSLCKVSSLAGWNGLASAVRHFETFRERVANKSFSSIAAFDREFQYIADHLEKIEKWEA